MQYDFTPLPYIYGGFSLIWIISTIIWIIHVIQYRKVFYFKYFNIVFKQKIPLQAVLTMIPLSKIFTVVIGIGVGIQCIITKSTTCFSSPVSYALKQFEIFFEMCLFSGLTLIAYGWFDCFFLNFIYK